MKALLAALALFVVAPAWAAEPTGFAEIPWGTLSHKVHEALYKKCEFDRADVGLAHCWGYQIAGVGTVDLQLKSLAAPGTPRADGRLAGYTIFFPWSGYREMRALSIEKYGAVFKPSDRAYITGTGAKVSGETMLWTWAGTTVQLNERCGKMTEGCLIVYTHELAEAQRAAGQADRAKARKAF